MQELLKILIKKTKIKFTWPKELMPLVDMKFIRKFKRTKRNCSKIIDSIEDDFNNDEKETKSYQTKMDSSHLGKLSFHIYLFGIFVS